MPRGALDRRWRPPSFGSVGATMLLALACSGSGAPDFFPAPPIEHGGAGGGAGKGGGSGGSGDMAGVGNESGAPDATGGTGAEPGGAGETSTGGTGGTGATGGATSGGVGGAEATGGTGGDQSTGGTGLGGLPGSGGDGAGGSTGGTSGGTGGSTGGSGGMGGLEPSAGTGGSSAGSGGSDAGTGGAAGLGGMAGTGGKSGGCVPTEPATEVCDGVDNDCDDGVDDGGVCPDDCVGAVFGKHRYLLCHGSSSYTRSEARSECVEHGEDLGVTMDLVRVESEEENGFLVDLIDDYPDTHAVWMSATDSSMAGAPREGSWIWGPQDYALLFYEDGKVVDDLFAGWAEDQPDDGGGPGSMENCAAFEPAYDYLWDDRACTEETDMFLCEQLHD